MLEFNSLIQLLNTFFKILNDVVENLSKKIQSNFRK